MKFEKVVSGFKIIPADFFCRPVLEVAKSLVGVYLFTRRNGVLCGGKIVECEAYLGSNDEASHASCGLTERNKYMFGPSGVAYVYVIYGIHHCFNVTAGLKNEAGALLIRSIKPEYGIEKMRERRDGAVLEKIAKGPANLTRSLGITLKDNGKNLPAEDLFFADNGREKIPFARTSRIGISKATDFKYRYISKKSNFISGSKKINRNEEV